VKTKTIKLSLSKECKHSHVFTNKEENVTFYIPKDIVGIVAPPTVYVTISEKETEDEKML